MNQDDFEDGLGWTQRWVPAFLHFLTLVKVSSKEMVEPGPIRPYEAQIRFLKELDRGLAADQHMFFVLKARQLGMCLDPATRVLTADLRWVKISEIQVGDELVATDEAPSGGTGSARRMRTAVVEATATKRAKTYRISFDDGRSVVCTGKHRWLSRKAGTSTSWRTVEGNGHRLKVGTCIRWITKPWDAPTVEDGWFSEMLDGEGSFALTSRKGASVCVAQREGAVWDRAVQYAHSRGYSYRIESDKAERLSKFGKVPVPKLVIGRMDEVFRLIGQTRPTRFSGRRFWENKDLPGKKSGVGWAKIVSIESLEEQEVVDLQTSTGTFIAEGFVSHNSTIMLALDIFWLFMFPGLQGALIADTDENRQQFRETITQMLDTLPQGFKIPVKRHNRGALVLENGSRLQYMAAGKGKNPDLGRSRGLNFCHGTEIGSWGDQDGVHSLIDALATENPHRLYVFESTAKGYNMFNAEYEKAKRDPTKRAMFIGWWAKELYRLPQTHPEFERWWGARPFLDEQETAMAFLIKQDYGVDLTPEQWAWWRERASSRSEQNLLQEFPWHERVAWQVTGSSFFNAKRINDDMAAIQSGLVTYDGYRYELGDRFLTMRCDKVATGAESDLKIYEGPVKNARYAMGVDVAYGRSEVNDRHCIMVYRCFSDKLVQVAEWTTSIPETRHVAWVLAHLAGSFRDCMINLEVSGPGLEVMTQMRMLRQDIEFAHLIPGLAPTFDAKHALEQARWFLYHRPDTPGQGYMYNWKTNHDNKQEMFNGFRDAYSTDQLIIRSASLLAEMTTLVQNGVTIQASARNKDDRPFATGLACYAWRQWIRLGMMQANRTYENEMRAQAAMQKAGGNVIEGLIPAFFARQEAARKERDFQRLLNN